MEINKDTELTPGHFCPGVQTVDKVSHYCAGFFFAKYQNVQCLCGFFGTFLV